MTTPYIVPAMLSNLAPFGIDWASIPEAGCSPAANTAALWDLCLVSSDAIDTTANMPLRATLDVETLMGPDQRLAIQGSTGVAVALMAHWPILSVVGAQWATTGGFPQTFSTIPANMLAVGEPSVSYIGGTSIPGGAGDGMNEIIVAPGYIDWTCGRNGYTVQLGYLNGWPHAGINQTAAAAATSIHVDDVTGFAGTQPTIWDAGSTEVVTVTAAEADLPVTVFGDVTVQAGPGTLTLASGLQYGHSYTSGPASAVVTAMPGVVRDAGYYFAAAESMQRGSTQISVPVLPGSVMTGGQPSARSFISLAQMMIKPLGRVF